MALPLRKSWSEREQVAAMRVVFGSLLAQLGHQAKLGDFITWTLLENRYVHVGSLNAHQGLFACGFPLE